MLFAGAAIKLATALSVLMVACGREYWERPCAGVNVSVGVSACMCECV